MEGLVDWCSGEGPDWWSAWAWTSSVNKDAGWCLDGQSHSLTFSLSLSLSLSLFPSLSLSLSLSVSVCLSFSLYLSLPFSPSIPLSLSLSLSPLSLSLSLSLSPSMAWPLGITESVRFLCLWPISYCTDSLFPTMSNSTGWRRFMEIRRWMSQ